ncbi:MAG: HIT family protein [Promethearchaeota archaeon]
MTEDCIFCKIIQKKAEAVIIYEDETFIAFLDHLPINDGHTLIVPKTHYKTLVDCPAETYGLLFNRAKKIGVKLIEHFDADGLTVLQNNGEASEQLVPHVHIHLVPRYLNDHARERRRFRQKSDSKRLKEIGNALKSLFKAN